MMAQLGHSTPAVTLRFYAREMSRKDDEPERLRVLVQGEEMPPTATEAVQATLNGIRATPNKPVNSAFLPE